MHVPGDHLDNAVVSCHSSANRCACSLGSTVSHTMLSTSSIHIHSWLSCTQPPPSLPLLLALYCLKSLCDTYACLCFRYPTTVATLSRRARDRIEAAFDRSVEGASGNPLIGTRLHDFGFRGCTCVEQSVLGGVAHLLNFDGSDTLSAAYYAQASSLCLA